MAKHPIARLQPSHPDLVQPDRADSLVAWFNLYMHLEAAAGSDNTLEAKRRDLNRFLQYFDESVGGDHLDDWTRSLTSGYLKHLQRTARLGPTTVNRALATLRHCAKWIHQRRPVVAGDPCHRISDLHTDAPEWKGLADMDVTRLKAAAEQLLHLKSRRNQNPVRDRAIFLVLLHTGLRVSELLALDFQQYRGKHFHNVRRKGKTVTRKIFLAQEAREALDHYLANVRGRDPGPLFCSQAGHRLGRQNIDTVLKALAAQANSRLPQKRRIHLSAHLLRHTMLRKAAEKHGVQYAMELSGHTSSRYIWRYIQPSEEEKEAALEDLF